MSDIILTSPLEVTPPATKVTNYSWLVTTNNIEVILNYYAANRETCVKQETFFITGDDFAVLRDAVITSGVVGQKYIDVIEKAIRNKIKSMKGFIGTVD